MTTDTRATRGGVGAWLLLAVPFIVQLVVVGTAAGLLAAVGERPPSDQYFYHLPNGVLYLIGFAAFGGATYLVARHLGPPRALLALRRTPLWPAVGWSVVALAGAIAVAAILEPLFGGSASQDLRQAAFPGGVSATLALGLVGFAFVIGAPVTEELYFRGLLLGRFAATLGSAAAVVATSGLFALAHFQPAAFPVILAIGAIFALLRLKTDSIWPPMVVHGINNALAFTIALLGP